MISFMGLFLLFVAARRGRHEGTPFGGGFGLRPLRRQADGHLLAVVQPVDDLGQFAAGRAGGHVPRYERRPLFYPQLPFARFGLCGGFGTQALAATPAIVAINAPARVHRVLVTFAAVAYTLKV